MDRYYGIYRFKLEEPIIAPDIRDLVLSNNDDAFTQRRGGITPPTALPGPHGIGDLGPMAYRFVDLLEQRLDTWQVCHLGLPHFGYSPYQSPSAFAGNPC